MEKAPEPRHARAIAMTAANPEPTRVASESRWDAGSHDSAARTPRMAATTEENAVRYPATTAAAQATDKAAVPIVKGSAPCQGVRWA